MTQKFLNRDNRKTCIFLALLTLCYVMVKMTVEIAVMKSAVVS